jgi:hypothetical protein
MASAKSIGKCEKCRSIRKGVSASIGLIKTVKDSWSQSQQFTFVDYGIKSGHICDMCVLRYRLLRVGGTAIVLIIIAGFFALHKYFSFSAEIIEIAFLMLIGILVSCILSGVFHSTSYIRETIFLDLVNSQRRLEPSSPHLDCPLTYRREEYDRLMKNSIRRML